MGILRPRPNSDRRATRDFSTRASYRPARCADGETRTTLLGDLRLVLYLEGSVPLLGEQIIS